MLALVLVACVSPSLTDLPSLTTESPAESATSSPLPTQTHPPQPTTAPTATHTSEPGTPTSTPVPRHIVKPLVTAPVENFGLRFDRWSPDSRWIAYWVGERIEGERDESQPAQLAFVDVLSDQVCPHAEVSAPDLESGTLLWQADGSAVAVLYPQEETWAGRPCETFAPVEIAPLPDSNTAVYLSQDGRYRAEVRILRWEGPLIYNEATISDPATGQTFVTTAYTGSAHILREPMWLTDELFLIGKTFDQGIRYIALPEGLVGNVLPDLLGLPAGDEEQIWRVDGHAESATGAYHLLLVGWKGESGSPLLLYHGELDRWEEIPFYNTWFLWDGTSFSPDGQWLAVGDPLEEGEPGASNDYWLWQVDPPGSTAVRIVRDIGPGGLSNQAKKMVFWKYSLIYIYGFPDGQLLGRWSAPGYDVNLTQWSPDGRWLMAWGLPQNETVREALFVLSVP